MSEGIVRAALDRYAPAVGTVDADWEDVLFRAGERRRRHRAVLVCVAVLALLGVTLATPALGLRNALLDLVGRERR